MRNLLRAQSFLVPSGEQVAEYQVAVWYEAGFEAKELRVTASEDGDPTKLGDATYVVCRDAFCERVEKARTALPLMPLSEEVVADYQTTRLSLKAHPMAFLRASLAERGFVRACDLRERKFRSMVQVAGVVLIRQRPGSAKGVCFITLEDETGVINLVVWPDLKEKQRRVVMGSRLMEVRGRVEYDDEVIHVIAHHPKDYTAMLGRLATRSRDFH